MLWMLWVRREKKKLNSDQKSSQHHLHFLFSKPNWEVSLLCYWWQTLQYNHGGQASAGWIHRATTITAILEKRATWDFWSIVFLYYGEGKTTQPLQNHPRSKMRLLLFFVQCHNSQLLPNSVTHIAQGLIPTYFNHWRDSTLWIHPWIDLTRADVELSPDLLVTVLHIWCSLSLRTCFHVIWISICGLMWGLSNCLHLERGTNCMTTWFW